MSQAARQSNRRKTTIVGAMVPSLTRLTTNLLLLLLLSSSTATESWTGWTCDELTPDLCDLEVTTGTAPMSHGLSTTYWKYSSPAAKVKASPKPLHPVIMVHGGPSFTHNYMLPLKQQACRGRDVYFYDQTGCGESKIPAANHTSDYPHLLDPQYYATVELPALIEHWGLEQYHVVGNSWGTILLQYFEINTRPKGLVSITLSGPLSDGDLYIASQWDQEVGNLASLPPFVQQRIHHLEETQSYDSEEYLAINDALTTYFTVRTAPGPDCWQASENGANKFIYDAMQGPSEFSFSGVLGHFNTTPRLPTVRVPVLLTSGTFDTMRPPCVDALYQTISKVEWTILPHSGHVSMIDDAGMMNDVVEDFLNRVEDVEASGEDFEPKNSACGPPGCQSKYRNDEESRASSNHLFPLWMALGSFCAGFAVNVLLAWSTHLRSQEKSGYEAI